MLQHISFYFLVIFFVGSTLPKSIIAADSDENLISQPSRELSTGHKGKRKRQSDSESCPSPSKETKGEMPLDLHFVEQNFVDPLELCLPLHYQENLQPISSNYLWPSLGAPHLSLPQGRLSDLPYHIPSPLLFDHTKLLVDVPTLESEVESCCLSVDLKTSSPQEEKEMKPYELDKSANPYVALQFTKTPSKVLGEDLNWRAKGHLYDYKRPTIIGTGAEFPKLKVKIQDNGTNETDKEYLERRLKGIVSDEDLDHIATATTFAGNGALSRVYHYHSAKPKGLSAVQETAWLNKNSHIVFKIRNPKPWNKTIQTASLHIRRDISLGEIFEQFSKNFKYIDSRGKTVELIRPAKYNRKFDEIGLGVLTQETIHGKSVAALQDLLNKARNGSDSEAISYLEKQFGSIDEVERRISAVEAFYMETHFDVIRFELQNKIPLAGNHTSKDHSVYVGFDFNHGHNVFWDEVEKVFKTLDF